MMIQVQGIYYADMAGLGLGLFRGKCVCIYVLTTGITSFLHLIITSYLSTIRRSK